MKKLFLLLACAPVLQAAAQNTGIGTLSPTDQLHTTGTVRFENYRGNGTRLLYLDSAGRIAVPLPGTLFSNTTRYSIPDNGCGSNNGASSPITVSGLGSSVPASKISVQLNITHTYNSDLRIFLFSPTGSILILANTVGSSSDNFTGSIFTDDAPGYASGATGPFSGRYKPETNGAACALTANAASFAAMGTGGNINPNGVWTLKVFDAATSDTGSIQSWQITFEGQNAFGSGGATGPVPYFNNGSLELSSISHSASGNVGIGTANPIAKLDVSGTLRVNDGTQGANKILTSNAAGVASWQTNAPLNSSFLAGINAPVTINSAGFNATLIPFTTTAGTLPGYDDAGAFSGGLFTAPATGVYHFDVGVGFNTATATTNGNITVVALLNGTTQLQQSQRVFSSGAQTPINIQYSFTCRLAAGNTLGMGLIVIGPASAQVYNNKDSYFSGYRVY